MGAVTIMLDVYTLISILYGFTYLQTTLIHACCLATSNIYMYTYICTCTVVCIVPVEKVLVVLHIQHSL